MASRRTDRPDHRRWHCSVPQPPAPFSVGAGGAGTGQASFRSGALGQQLDEGAQAEVGIVPFTTAGVAISTASSTVVRRPIGGGGGQAASADRPASPISRWPRRHLHQPVISTINAGIISTTGDNSFGVLLQTIGGGGGVAGSLHSAHVSLSNTNANSNSGNITFTNSGTIATSGTGSHRGRPDHCRRCWFRLWRRQKGKRHLLARQPHRHRRCHHRQQLRHHQRLR